MLWSWAEWMKDFLARAPRQRMIHNPNGNTKYFYTQRIVKIYPQDLKTIRSLDHVWVFGYIDFDELLKDL